MPNRVALLRAEIEAAHPGAVMRHRGECGFSMRVAPGVSVHKYTTGPWHWHAHDVDPWLEIDTDLEPRADSTWKHGVKSARFDTLLSDDGRRRFIPRRWKPDEFVEFGALEFRRLNGQWRTVPTGIMSRVENRLVGADSTDGQLVVGFHGRGSRTMLTLKRSTWARPIRWSVTLSGLSWVGGRLVSLSDGAEVGFIRPPTWTDAAGRTDTIPWEYRDGAITLTPDLAGAQFPVTVDPDYSVSAGANDGYCYFTDFATPTAGGWDATSTSMRFGTFTTGPGVSYVPFLRFPGISANREATVTAASLKVYSTGAGYGAGMGYATVYAVDVDDYAMPADDDACETQYGQRTTAAQSASAWDAGGGGQSKTWSSLTGPPEEVFARANWKSGNALGLIFVWTINDAANYQGVASYENTSYTEPVLSLTVTGGITPVTSVGSWGMQIH